MQNKGFESPDYCLLCKKNLETIFYLFVECPFTCSVWERIKSNLKFSGAWTGKSMSEGFKNWRLLFSSYLTLLTYIYWNIWIEQNLVIFENWLPFVQKVVLLSLLLMVDYKIPIKSKAIRRRSLQLVGEGSEVGLTRQQSHMGIVVEREGY